MQYSLTEFKEVSLPRLDYSFSLSWIQEGNCLLKLQYKAIRAEISVLTSHFVFYWAPKALFSKNLPMR